MSAPPSPTDCPPTLTPLSLAGASVSTPSMQRTSLSPPTSGGWDQSTDIRQDLAAGWGGGRASAAVGNQSGVSEGTNSDDDWGWRLKRKAVHPVSPFYPMDPRSTRRITLADGEDGGEEINDNIIGEISHRISSACKDLSVHGIWDNKCSSAMLNSMERVEMQVTVYLGDSYTTAPQVLIVEVQQRKGCSVTFHNYRRCLLDAAEGKFDLASFHKTDGLDKPLGRDRTNQPRASLGRPGLGRPGPARPSLSRSGSTGQAPSPLGRPSLAKPSLSPSSRPSLARPTLSPPGSSTMARPAPMGRPSNVSRPSPFRTPLMDSPGSGVARSSLRSPSFSADDAVVPNAGLKTEGLIPKTGEGERKGDRILEKALEALNMAASLIKKDRADARRLGMESLVLLTDPLRAGMETAKIASRVVLLGSANSDTVAIGNNDDDVDALFDESAGLGIRENILAMIMEHNESDSKMVSENDAFEGIEKEFADSHFYLCLTVLSNALHTIEESVKMATTSHQNKAPSLDQVEQETSNSSNRKRAATEPSVSKQFIDDTESGFGSDVLSSLIRILGQAKTKPHDAYHSARCLGVLFKGCGNSHRIRARRDLDAKSVVAAALEVGCRSHAKLEDASRVAMTALVTDDEENDEEGAKEVEREGGSTP